MPLMYNNQEICRTYLRKGVALDKIEITKQPKKLVYIVGEDWDPTEIEADAIFANGMRFHIPQEYLTYSIKTFHNSATDHVRVSLPWGRAAKYEDVPVLVSPRRVIGVRWNYNGATPVLARLTPKNDPNGLCTYEIFDKPVPANASTGVLTGSSPFDNIMPWAGMEPYNIVDSTVVSKLGDEDFSFEKPDVMVYIPKFYCAVIDDPTNKMRYFYVSDKPGDDLVEHPGSGKFVSRYFASAGYRSRTGVSKIMGQNITMSRFYSARKGDGWSQYDYATWCAIWLLYLVEYATWDSQRAIGYGCGYSYNEGLTDTLGYHTGLGTNSSVQYRYIEGLWGTTGCWTDGFYATNNASYICTDPDKFAENVTDDYDNTTVICPTCTSESYVKNVGMSKQYPWAYLPIQTTSDKGSASTYLTDTYIKADGTRNLMTSYASGTDQYGIMHMRLEHDANSTYAYVGTRLIFDPARLPIPDEPDDVIPEPPDPDPEEPDENKDSGDSDSQNSGDTDSTGGDDTNTET